MVIDEQFMLDLVRTNPINLTILDRLSGLGILQAHLVAGSVFQAIWNYKAGASPDYGVADYDIAYFDDNLSYEAEEAVIRRATTLFSDIPVKIEVRNQARVHLWYPDRFGTVYPKLCSARDGIDRYLVECTCIAIAADDKSLYAPYGFSDLWEGILRPNRRSPSFIQYAAKAESYRARWPWLTITP